MLKNYFKINSDYLAAISLHLDEKTKVIVSSVENNRMPLVEDKVSMLEVGIGGGQTICALNNQLKNKIDITAIDIYPELVKIGNKSNTKSLLANVCNLPFDDNSFSCVNAASVLHEVSSYGYADNISTVYGIEAVKLALKEIKRVLLPNGMFFYRDILAPDKNEIKKVDYKLFSWKFFIDYFLLDFVDSEPAFYKDNYSFKKCNSYYSIIAQSNLHREIQKHYLLWISGLIKELSKKYRIDSYLSIERKISKINKNDKLFKEIKKNLQNWLLREGKEYYLYWSIDEILNYCINDTDDKGMIFFQKCKNNIMKLTRNKENEYLKKVIVNPEIEGKQIINFTKIAL